MLSLLVLFALVGAAETCNLKRSGQNGDLFTDLNVHPTVCPRLSCTLQSPQSVSQRNAPY